MLSRKNRLSSKEFQNIFKKGKRAKGVFGMLISLPSSNISPRFGFVVSSKIGNAVYRHKMTRRLRNITRNCIRDLDIKNMDFQYIAFKYAENYSDLEIEFKQQVSSLVK